MAAAIRVTFFYGQAQSGWSETWWRLGSLNSTTAPAISSLALARNNLLTVEHQLLAVRVAEEGGSRKSRVYLGGTTTSFGVGGTSVVLPGKGREIGIGANLVGRPDQLRAAAHMEVISGGVRIALRYIAGIPDSLSLTEHPTINPDPNAAWRTAFGLYRDELLKGLWAVKKLDKGADYPLMNVLTYRLKAPAPAMIGVVVSNAQPFTAGVGDKVALQGVRSVSDYLENPNGTWVIDGTEVDQALGQRTIWLRGTEGYDPANFKVLGKVRQVAYEYVVPSDLNLLRVGIHKRGKPFGQLVGRRPA